MYFFTMYTCCQILNKVSSDNKEKVLAVALQFVTLQSVSLQTGCIFRKNCDVYCDVYGLEDDSHNLGTTSRLNSY